MSLLPGTLAMYRTRGVRSARGALGSVGGLFAKSIKDDKEPASTCIDAIVIRLSEREREG